MTTKHKRQEGELEFKLLLAATMPVFLCHHVDQAQHALELGPRQTLSL